MRPTETRRHNEATAEANVSEFMEYAEMLKERHPGLLACWMQWTGRVMAHDVDATADLDRALAALKRGERPHPEQMCTLEARAFQELWQETECPAWTG